MKQPITRREFITTSTAVAAGLSLALPSSGSQTPPGTKADRGPAAQPPTAPPPLTFKTKPHKALSAHPSEDDLKRMKEAGFDGVECRSNVTPDETAKLRAAGDKLGLRIHSVLIDKWSEFNHPDQSVVERSFADSEAALRTAEAFGADTVLLVPGRIGGGGGPGAPESRALHMPRAWEFQIEFNEKDGHLTRVVYGDNAPFVDYIKAHDHATDTTRELIRRLIPLAEKTKVIIAIENVGNNLWVQPQIFRHFVQSFQSPWVQAYFDIGNHVRYAPPEQWILTLNTLIAKIHVKDYLLNPSDPDGRGSGVNLREGSVRWPVLRQALEVINYNGWMSIESNTSLSFEERNRRLDLILAGQ
ncbi:MAG TPA: sugar phosphate isomerase/epimerase family protein [Patescibacteria group bacterium]|jgi:hexulose-6-phosphate isomerase|nr:sugar phosphate isomerase/epimerase family protein [Patescibacteria group bacterium]